MSRDSFREESVLPSLFWRIEEAEQTRSVRGVPVAVYRAEVLRNIRWLLSTSAHRADSLIHRFPHAASSVLNFGIPPYAGKYGDSVDLLSYANRIRDAIARFEPRIIASSISVTVTSFDDSDRGSVGFLIVGNLWSQPVPERFTMETSIDTASGQWRFDG